MKAEEYAESFLSKEYKTKEELEQAVFGTCVAFFKEVNEISEMRHSKSNECLIAIFKEQSRKWRVFARIVNSLVEINYIKPDGFKDFAILQIPQLKGRI